MDCNFSSDGSTTVFRNERKERVVKGQVREVHRMQSQSRKNKKTTATEERGNRDATQAFCWRRDVNKTKITWVIYCARAMGNSGRPLNILNSNSESFHLRRSIQMRKYLHYYDLVGESSPEPSDCEASLPHIPPPFII